MTPCSLFAHLNRGWDFAPRFQEAVIINSSLSALGKAGRAMFKMQPGVAGEGGGGLEFRVPRTLNSNRITVKSGDLFTV